MTLQLHVDSLSAQIDVTATGEIAVVGINKQLR